MALTHLNNIWSSESPFASQWVVFFLILSIELTNKYAHKQRHRKMEELGNVKKFSPRVDQIYSRSHTKWQMFGIKFHQKWCAMQLIEWSGFLVAMPKINRRYLHSIQLYEINAWSKTRVRTKTVNRDTRKRKPSANLHQFLCAPNRNQF